MGQFILDGTSYSRLIDGAQTTVLILLFAFILGVVLSVVVGVLRLNAKAWVRGAALVFVEFFREPDVQLGYLYGGWLTMGMILSIPMVLLGVGLVISAKRRPA